MSSENVIAKKEDKKRKKSKKGITDTNLLVLIAVSVFVVLYMSTIIAGVDGFDKPQTTADIFDGCAPLMVAACGMTIVMIVGGIDISISGVMALVCAVDTYFINVLGRKIVIGILGKDASEFAVSVTIIILSVVVALLLGALFGAVQGFLVAYLNIQPFIITMAGLFLSKGLTEAFIPLLEGDIDVKDELFNKIKMDDSFRLELKHLINYYPATGAEIATVVKIGTIVALIIVLLIFILLKWTKLGRNIYAVGGNRQSALMLGINVRKTVFSSHLLCGILAGAAGYIYFLTVGSTKPSYAAGLEMEAIAAAIIGGTLLSGGVGNVIGTFFGVATLKLMVPIINAVGNQMGLLMDNLQNLMVGVLLTIFLVIQSVIMGVRHRKKV